MPKFDRYILSQLMILFGFFALVLVSIYWINRAVGLFDQLISNGQTAAVVLEFTILTLPNVIGIVLPVAAFAASVYATNRLASDSELVVAQSTGYSPFRLARPVLIFGLIVALLLSALVHFLVPAAQTEFNRRQAEISDNITARLLTEGVFLHPVPGITFYIREITAEGELRDVFLSDARAGTSRTTYIARRALLLRSDTGPKLVMFDGMAQDLRLEDNRLATTSFSDLSLDIGSMITAGTAPPRNLVDLTTPELLNADAALLATLGATRTEAVQEFHGRLNQSALAIVASLAGFAALLVGGFSRFGMWRQIIGAVILLIVLKSLDNAMTGMVARGALAWPFLYVASIVGLGICWALLWISGRPALFKRRERLSA